MFFAGSGGGVSWYPEDADRQGGIRDQGGKNVMEKSKAGGWGRSQGLQASLGETAG